MERKRKRGASARAFSPISWFFSADPAAVDPGTIRDITVDLTVVDGTTVFAREPEGAPRCETVDVNRSG
ncbi:MAG: hypothetical protein ACOCW3_00555 [Spirochaetota bacterium]